MKKLILLLIALPLLLANCSKESQPDGPTNTTTNYKGIFTTGTIDANLQELPALVVVTENSATDWSMSLEVSGQPAQVLAVTKTGEIIMFTDQTYQGTTVNGKGDVTNNGNQLRFTVESTGATTTTTVGSFLGQKQ